MRAGLLPALRGGLFTEAGSRWRVGIMRPGDDPLGNLARSLASPGALGREGEGGSEREAVTEAVLRHGSLGLVEAARHARLPAEENLLVVVEQLEDLFRIRPAGEAKNADDASAFVRLLLEAAAQTELPLYVVLVLRAGYTGDCARFRGLPEAINDGMRLVPRMTRDEAREAVTGPVRVSRAGVTPRLVERLLNDAGNDPRGLPAFQHALRRTWEAWRREGAGKESLDLRHYEEAGEVGASLSRHAGETGRAQWTLNPESYLSAAHGSTVRAYDTNLERMTFGVERGEVVVFVRALRKGVSLTIRTPPGPITVYKAGLYRFRVAEDGETVASVVRGELRYVEEAGNLVVVKIR